LGEYGTADGKFSASYVTGKLCDVAESYSSDETVKVSLAFQDILILFSVGFLRHLFFFFLIDFMLVKLLIIGILGHQFLVPSNCMIYVALL
jgi:hypothetical protein